MRHSSLLQITILTAVLAVGPLAGCTAIGYLIGSRVDKGRDKKIESLGGPQEVQTVKPGTAVELQLHDGRVLRGRYQGLDWAMTHDYASRYEDARRDLGPGVELPALGPRARLALTRGSVATGELLGFGPGFVLFHEDGVEEPTRVELYRIASVADAGGRTVQGGRLESLVADGRIPLLAGVMLEQYDGTIVVPYRDVMTVGRLVSPSGGKIAGTIVGAAVDALLIAAIVSWDSSWDDSSTETEYSCPLVDSFDGEGWSLDAEPLAGAVYAGAQRTDSVRLEHLVPVGGEYRLRVRNDQSEIDHVDSVALRVVDHDPGVEVVPDARGRLHAVRVPLPPARGHDLRGTPTAGRLAAPDGNLWVSDPWGRRPDRPEDLRDGVELEFPRPPGTRAAILVIRAGTTSLGPRVLTQALALQGRELPAFFTRLNRDPEARAAFEAVREREVLPIVRVWDGREWRKSGVLHDPPVRVFRDVAVPLNLDGVDGDPLRIRIDGPPGLWSLDRAVVAWPSEDTFRERRIPLRRAEGESGKVLTDLLAHADGQRHVLRPHRDRVTLAFPAPPLTPGRARSVLVEATGFYIPLVPVEGGPQHAAFERLVEEPGALARFVIENLRETPDAPAPPTERADPSATGP